MKLTYSDKRVEPLDDSRISYQVRAAALRRYLEWEDERLRNAVGDTLSVMSIDPSDGTWARV